MAMAPGSRIATAGATLIALVIGRLHRFRLRFVALFTRPLASLFATTTATATCSTATVDAFLVQIAQHPSGTAAQTTATTVQRELLLRVGLEQRHFRHDARVQIVVKVGARFPVAKLLHTLVAGEDARLDDAGTVLHLAHRGGEQVFPLVALDRFDL